MHTHTCGSVWRSFRKEGLKRGAGLIKGARRDIGQDTRGRIEARRLGRKARRHLRVRTTRTDVKDASGRATKVSD